MTLDEAIKSLDPNNSDHWTSDGLPSLDFLRELTLDDKLTREQVTRVAPELIREVAPEQELDPPKTDAERVNDLDNRISEIDGQIAELSATRDRLMSRRLAAAAPSTVYDHKRDMQEKLRYLESQKKLRQEKYQRKVAFLGSAAGHLEPGDMETRAKIDQAMARKTARGGKRPPVKGSKVE